MSHDERTLFLGLRSRWREREPFRGDQGEIIGRGWQLCTVRSTYEDPDDLWTRFGVLLTEAAGVTHRLQALQLPAFAPGSPVALVHEPENPYDKNAVAVWDWGADCAGWLRAKAGCPCGRQEALQQASGRSTLLD